jgi:hypothetical protein
MAETLERTIGKCKGKPGYSGMGRPTNAFREKHKGTIRRSIATVAEKFKDAQGGAPETGPGAKYEEGILIRNGLKIKPPGVKWGVLIPEWAGHRGPPTHELRIKHGFAEPAKEFSWSDIIPEYKGEGMPSDEVLLEHNLARKTESGAIIKIKPKGAKWGDVIEEHRGKKGPAPLGLRIKHGFAEPRPEKEKAEKEPKPKKFSWKNIPEYTGRGLPSDPILERYGLPTRSQRAEMAQKADAPNNDTKVMARADGLKIKPKGVKWGEVISEWKGRMGPPTRALLEKYGFAPLSTWKEPKKKAPKQENAYMNKQFRKNLIEDGPVVEPPDENEQDEIEALLPEEKPVEKRATARNAAAARPARRERVEETQAFISTDSERRAFDAKMERLRIGVETLEGTGRPEEAKKAWAEIADIYRSKGLNLLAGAYFKKAGEYKKAAQAFNACGEYDKAKLCREKANETRRGAT